MNKVQLFRYDSHQSYDGLMRITLSTYDVVRETEKSFVIKNGDKDVFILKGDNGKRFAYSTRTAALKGFQARTARRVLLSAAAFEKAQQVLFMINHKGDDLIALAENCSFRG